MRKITSFFIGICLFSNIVAQEPPIITLTSQDVEVIFLQQNLELIAGRLNITMADASIAQAKLWENPTLSISDVNLWSTKSQREGEKEVIPPLFGSFARNTEFSIELSQLIQTANKRGKRIRMEQANKEISIQEFEDVLRSLKVELRQAVQEVIYLDAYREVLDKQINSLSLLINSYQKQVTQGNLAKSEVLRLQSALLDAENEYNEIRTELNAQQKNLKILLNADPFVYIRITGDTIGIQAPDQLILSDLMSIASGNRPDMKIYQSQTNYFEKALAYEKSQRVPDITFSANYDRYGGVWKDFIGFGVSIDLPFFNRNQGNIKMAKAGRDQSLILAQQKQNQIHHEIAEAYNNYSASYNFYRRITGNPLLQELDPMLDIYTKNLLNRNISMIEYIDFMEAYKSNKQAWLTARKNLRVQFEELQYSIGTNIK